MHRIPTIIISLLLAALCAEAAPMSRVTAIRNGRTIIVDGTVEVRLAGIEITNEVGARELLRWTIGTSWVMVERTPDGGALVYRSPDAMCINRELVLRGYARATDPALEPQRIVATYLGVVNPGPPRAPERVDRSSRAKEPKASRAVAPHISTDARKLPQTAGRSGEPKSAQRKSAPR
jgi:hypothetical protein